MITFYQSCKVFTTRKDGYGKTVRENEQITKCRVKEKYQLVKNQVAEEVVSQLEVTLPPEVIVNTSYILEYENEEYIVISVKMVRNTIGEIVKKVVYV